MMRMRNVFIVKLHTHSNIIQPPAMRLPNGSSDIFSSDTRTVYTYMNESEQKHAVIIPVWKRFVGIGIYFKPIKCDKIQIGAWWHFYFWMLYTLFQSVENEIDCKSARCVNPSNWAGAVNLWSCPMSTCCVTQFC